MRKHPGLFIRHRLLIKRKPSEYSYSDGFLEF